jgi:hypothetical protein
LLAIIRFHVEVDVHSFFVNNTVNEFRDQFKKHTTDVGSLGKFQIALSASHSSDDIKRLVNALAPWFPVKHAEQSYAVASKLRNNIHPRTQEKNYL